MWEQRHGFPVPKRLPSGHRRYSHLDVELIRQVMRDRESGLELRAAVENAKRAARGERPVIEDDSIYSGLRRRRPDLKSYLLTKRHPDPGQPRDRGRVRVRLPARACCSAASSASATTAPPSRAGATWPPPPSAPSCWPTSTSLATPDDGPVEVPIDSTRAARPRVVAGLRRARLRRGAQRLGAPGPGGRGRHRPPLRGALERGARAGPRRLHRGLRDRRAGGAGRRRGHRGPAGRGRWSPSSPA